MVMLMAMVIMMVMAILPQRLASREPWPSGPGCLEAGAGVWGEGLAPGSHARSQQGVSSPDTPQPLPVHLTDSDLTREGRRCGRYVSGPDPLLLLGHPGPLTKGKGREFFFFF